MWKRFRRRTLAPRRPAVFPEQWPLVVLTALVIVMSIAAVIYVLAH
jgi:hypothetical protein